MYLLLHFCIQGNIPFMQLEGMHQLHILLFVLVIVHVIYSVMIMALGMWKVSMNIISCSFIFTLLFYMDLCDVIVQVSQWKAWEERSCMAESLGAHGIPFLFFPFAMNDEN